MSLFGNKKGGLFGTGLFASGGGGGDKDFDKKPGGNGFFDKLGDVARHFAAAQMYANGDYGGAFAMRQRGKKRGTMGAPRLMEGELQKSGGFSDPLANAPRKQHQPIAGKDPMGTIYPQPFQGGQGLSPFRGRYY